MDEDKYDEYQSNNYADLIEDFVEQFHREEFDDYCLERFRQNELNEDDQRDYEIDNEVEK